MAENIFRSEIIKKYNTKNRTAGIGEYVLRNGIWCMDIRPEPFYKNIDNNTSGILFDEFILNTSYIIDMWIDVDDVVYNNNNVAAGFTLYYTDNTTESFAYTGGGSNSGFHHKKIITPITKSIKSLEIYYYTSSPVYYRWDSYIVPVETLNINKQGQILTAQTIENQDIASFSKGGSIYLNNFYEY